MGVDITLHIEYDITPEFKKPDGLAKFSITRNRVLFRALGLYKEDCLIPARGFPFPVSFDAEDDYRIFVVDKINEDELGQYKFITYENAISHVLNGESHFLKDNKGNECESYISNPDFISPSWLTLQEVLDCLSFSEISSKDLNWDFEMVLITMISLEKFKPNIKTRIVFWFDE